MSNFLPGSMVPDARHAGGAGLMAYLTLAGLFIRLIRTQYVGEQG
jgi:hypothetical protein